MAQRVCDPGKDFESFSEWSFWWRAARAGMPKVERASYEGIGLQKGQLWIQGLLEEMEGFTTRSWLPETSKTELESDLQRVMEAMVAHDDAQSQLAVPDEGSPLWLNRRFALDFLTVYGDALAHAPEEMKADREIVCAAVGLYGYSLRFAIDELRSDKEVVLKAASTNFTVLQHATREFCESKECMLEAVKLHGLSLEYASPELKADRDVVLAAVQENGSAISMASVDLRADREVMLAAVRFYNPFAAPSVALQHASAALRSDRELVLEAVRQRGQSALRHASEELLADKDFVLLAARQSTKEFGKVDWLRKSGVDATDFNRSYWSSLAVAGQDSPILNARLLLVPREGEDGKTNFSCEVSLLSGASFACQLANSEMLGPFGSKRPGPLLNDLAKMLVEELPRCTEVVGVKHIFLAFQMSGNADSKVVTPWEWRRPLVDFLFS
mmetsp:Transcript_2793/g.6745  ORF Transcript_2793/g.6745 Transcript_2793/m.6745 type:complete len:443 (-) Transcript_2793:334-1662(-)